MPADGEYPQIPGGKGIVLFRPATLQKFVIATKRSRPIRGDQSIETEESDQGTKIKVSKKKQDGIQTVTGAVNGVPATLNVLTDGKGWKAIPTT